MKVTLNSELLNRGIHVGVYQTYLGDLDIMEECYADFEQYIMDAYKEHMEEILKEKEINCTINPTRIDKPRFYNYSDNAVVFDINLEDNFMTTLEASLEDLDFIDFISNNYKNCSGFISFMPSSGYEFKKAIKDDLERAVASYLNYTLKDITEIIQSEFEEKVADVANGNGWIDYEDCNDGNEEE